MQSGGVAQQDYAFLEIENRNGQCKTKSTGENEHGSTLEVLVRSLEVRLIDYGRRQSFRGDQQLLESNAEH